MELVKIDWVTMLFLRTTISCSVATVFT